jgi:NADH:ubiquinone oxidoreductase subunit 5 (subunit L)/multisubunit Na+/H+ antiporter MnhA subunit
MRGEGWLLWALIALPLGSGVLLAAAGRAADRIASRAAVAVAAAVTVLACLAAARRPAAGAPLLEGLPVRLAVDGLSACMVVTVAAVTLLVLVFSAAGPEEARARFFGLMLLFAGAMLTAVTATTLPVLLMAWEVMGAVSWALIGYWWREPERVNAATTAFLTTRAADLGLYLAAGAALAGGPSASLALDDLPDAAGPWLSLATAGIIAAALGKSAQLPFSFWLSGAMRGPGPVSALLHSATLVVAGAYLLLRCGPLLDASGWGGPLVAWTGAVTAVALGLVAVAQTDLKQLLAASSCAQIGFMVLAAGVGSTTGGILQLMAHAAAKSLAFLAVDAWSAGSGSHTLPALRGAARRHRAVGTAFTVALLAVAGLPPLALWAAKDVLLAAALADTPWLYAAGLAGAAISAVYSVKALWFVWRPARAPAAPAVPAPAGGALLVLAAACLALTPFAFAPLRDPLGTALGGPAHPAPHAWEFALSAAVVLTAAGMVWARDGRASPLPARVVDRGVHWLGLEKAARAVVVTPVLRLSRALAAFDDRVLDRAAVLPVRGAARLSRALARCDDRALDRAVDGAALGAVRLARLAEAHPEQRGVDAGVEWVALATRRLGRLARRPQTGQLHQYLAQAVAALTVLAAVFVLVR